MTTIGWLQIVLFAAIVGLITGPLGGYLLRVYAGERTFLQLLIRPVEAALYRMPESNRRSNRAGSATHSLF
jgi:K+-transporting ATPase ATPase A chain